ncbi:hypothetical protein GE09DRAFT_575330 [Coniochaeta sp. 2T2.1]|nr:hypothetical protein GE09DRAFT_575330 [Coniochaeta sp. 2T2.1]
MSNQAQEQPVPTTVERRCRRLFSRLNRLGEKLKRHDHQTTHFNIQNALQHVEAQCIQPKFTERAAIKGRGECKEAEKSLYTCVAHLDSCLKTCERMGTPQWTASDDSTLSDSWTLFVANFKHTTRLLDLPELDLRPFLGLQPQSSVENPRPSSNLFRRDSDQSESSSRAETIENWNALRDRQDQVRLAGIRAERTGALGMTATGTRFPRPPHRPASLLSFSSTIASSVSSASSASTVRPSPTPTPASPAPAAPKIAEALASTDSVVSSRPPPPYSPNPSIKITTDDKSDPDAKDNWDTKTLVSSPLLHKRAASDSGIQSLRRAASDVSLSSTASSSSSAAHFHFHAGSNANFHLQPPWPGSFGQQRPAMPPPPMMPGPYPVMQSLPTMSAPALLLPVPPGPGFGYQPTLPPPSPVPRPIAYKASRTSLRETAALHMLRQGAPGVVLHAVKPEVTCEHGVVHFKQHAYCGWENCCNRRGCEV